MSKINLFGLAAACIAIFAVNSNAREPLDVGLLESYTLTDTLELKPIPDQTQAFQIARSQFLPDFVNNDFSNFSHLDKNYNTGDCKTTASLFTTKSCSYPRAVLASSKCPFRPGYYKECACLPQFKLSSCTSPKFGSSPTCDGKFEKCICPPTIKLNNAAEKCTKYCDGNCISKSCTPLTDETGCQYGTETASDNCGGTRNVCKNCSLPTCTNITTKPENSSYTTASCTDCSGTKTVNTGWTCNSGYSQSGNACTKNCSLAACSSITTKPENSSYITASCTDCSGTKTVNTGWTCNSGYSKSGNTCTQNCTLAACSSITSKPENSSYTTASCTDCSGTQTINSGWTCNSGFYKSGSSCVKECNLPACTSITSKPENSSYTTASCTDCSGTKTINSGWTCNSGFYKSGSSCVKECNLPACTSIASKPENSSYTTASCTDCSGTKTVNTGWACNSGYSKSGSSCVKECNLPTCTSITSKPENSSYTIASCTDCSGTKTVNTGWNCNSGYHKDGNTCKADCIPAADETGCEFGTISESDGCGGTHKICDISNFEKCAKEGFYNMGYWNARKPGNGNMIIESYPVKDFDKNVSLWNKIYQELIGLKTANATSMISICQVCKLEGCGYSKDCLSFCPDVCSIKADFVDYVFVESERCPYDSSFVKGKWVKIQAADSVDTKPNCGSETAIKCSGTWYCCDKKYASCSYTISSSINANGTMRYMCSIASQQTSR